MEAQAATMMITLVGKSAETTVRVAAKSAEMLLKMVAFLTALWKKSSAKGQVKMAKLLESGAPLSAIAMNSENYKKFAELAKQESFIYHAAYREDIDSYLVTLKTEDLQRVKTAMQFYDMNMNVERQDNIPKESTPDVKIENVNMDRDAMHKMDELDKREAEELKQEVRENAEEFDFAARKQEVLKENDAVDYDEWVQTAKEGDALPDNLTVCLKADQEVFDELEKMKKEDLLNEANVVKGLKAEKLNELGKNMPKVKAKDIGIEL